MSFNGLPYFVYLSKKQWGSKVIGQGCRSIFFQFNDKLGIKINKNPGASHEDEYQKYILLGRFGLRPKVYGRCKVVTDHGHGNEIYHGFYQEICRVFICGTPRYSWKNYDKYGKLGRNLIVKRFPYLFVDGDSMYGQYDLGTQNIGRNSDNKMVIIDTDHIALSDACRWAKLVEEKQKVAI